MAYGKVTIIGRGFLARELAKRDLPDAVYYFSGVSSNSILTESFDTTFRSQLEDWQDILMRCRDERKLLVYASSATVAQKTTPYSRLKGIMEDMALAYSIESLGIRLPAVYGRGEAHKGAAASIPYKFLEQIRSGKSPVIYGDGEQTRDFMYIDDAIDNIVGLTNDGARNIQSIGTGIHTSFNSLIETINSVLDTNIKPIYVSRPQQYIEELPTVYSPFSVQLREGIEKML